MTVAVVVPSPTMSLVLIAASLTSWAPMFSNWSLRWISRAIVTPSLVTTGEPVIFSRMTLRPLGPSVDFTASASWSTPDCSSTRASSPNRRSLAMRPPGVGCGAVSWGGAVGRPARAGSAGPPRGCARVRAVRRLALTDHRGIPLAQQAAAHPAVGLDADPGQARPCQVQRQHLGADGRAGRGVDQQRRVVPGGQAQLGAPAAQPLPVGGGRRLAQGEAGELVGRHAVGEQRAADPVRARQHGLAQEVGPQAVELVHRLALEGLHEARPARRRRR